MKKISILKQIKKRRLALGLKQKDMFMRVGISRQQYQQLEVKGNPRLETLELMALGLNCELRLIPKEKIDAVDAILDPKNLDNEEDPSLDPWKGLLGDENE